ncbi:unnamed protein product, partial [Ectocarpus sp. 8 AP-2014]
GRGGDRRPGLHSRGQPEEAVAETERFAQHFCRAVNPDGRATAGLPPHGGRRRAPARVLDEASKLGHKHAQRLARVHRGPRGEGRRPRRPLRLKDQNAFEDRKRLRCQQGVV